MRGGDGGCPRGSEHRMQRRPGAGPGSRARAAPGRAHHDLPASRSRRCCHRRRCGVGDDRQRRAAYQPTYRPSQPVSRRPGRVPDRRCLRGGQPVGRGQRWHSAGGSAHRQGHVQDRGPCLRAILRRKGAVGAEIPGARATGPDRPGDERRACFPPPVAGQDLGPGGRRGCGLGLGDLPGVRLPAASRPGYWAGGRAHPGKSPVRACRCRGRRCLGVRWRGGDPDRPANGPGDGDSHAVTARCAGLLDPGRIRPAGSRAGNGLGDGIRRRPAGERAAHRPADQPGHRGRRGGRPRAAGGCRVWQHGLGGDRHRPGQGRPGHLRPRPVRPAGPGGLASRGSRPGLA